MEGWRDSELVALFEPAHDEPGTDLTQSDSRPTRSDADLMPACEGQLAGSCGFARDLRAYLQCEHLGWLKDNTAGSPRHLIPI